MRSPSFSVDADADLVAVDDTDTVPPFADAAQLTIVSVVWARPLPERRTNSTPNVARAATAHPFRNPIALPLSDCF